MSFLPRLLVVAGHDPSGAGIDADRAALAGLALDARFVVTARTEQDEGGVRALGARPAEEWLAEALRELPAAALKFGLLPGALHLRAAAELVRAARVRLGHAGGPGGFGGAAGESGVLWAIVDPVLASSSGSRFLAREEAREYLRALAPAGVVLTPNLPELAELAGADLARLVGDPAARVEAAGKLLASGAVAVVAKGGHGEESPVRDLVLTSDGRLVWLAHERIPGGKVRGSGCRFATRLAARLALGMDLEEAVRDASLHVLARIRAAGRGA